MSEALTNKKQTSRDELLEATVRALKNQVANDADQVVYKEIREQVLREEIATQKERLRKKVD